MPSGDFKDDEIVDKLVAELKVWKEGEREGGRGIERDDGEKGGLSIFSFT